MAAAALSQSVCDPRLHHSAGRRVDSIFVHAHTPGPISMDALFLAPSPPPSQGVAGLAAAGSSRPASASTGGGEPLATDRTLATDRSSLMSDPGRITRGILDTAPPPPRSPGSAAAAASASGAADFIISTEGDSSSSSSDSEPPSPLPGRASRPSSAVSAAASSPSRRPPPPVALEAPSEKPSEKPSGKPSSARERRRLLRDIETAAQLAAGGDEEGPSEAEDRLKVSGGGGAHPLSREGGTTAHLGGERVA